MKLEEIQKQIEDIEKQLEITEVNMVSVDYYEKLLNIHRMLWDFAYFKKYEENKFLDPPKEEDSIMKRKEK